MKLMYKNMKMYPNCDDRMKMKHKNLKMYPKCSDIMKMTPRNCKAELDFAEPESEAESL